MEGLLIGAISVLGWEYIKSVRFGLKFEHAYWAERRGRARVEKEMKRISDIQVER